LSYRVLLSNQAEKFYKKLPKNVRGRVRRALISLENNLTLEKSFTETYKETTASE